MKSIPEMTYFVSSQINYFEYQNCAVENYAFFPYSSIIFLYHGSVYVKVLIVAALSC